MEDEQGWVGRNINAWYKPNGMPASFKDRFTNRWEPVFFFTKEPRYWFDLDSVREPYLIDEGRPGGIVRAREYGYESKFEGLMGIPDWKEVLKDRAKAGGAQREAYEFFLKWSIEHPEGTYEEFYAEVSSKKLSSHQDMKWQEGMDPKETAWGNYASYLHLPSPAGKNPGDILETSIDEMVQAYREVLEAIASSPEDFWEINTEPHPFAHFAVYPDKLVERPVKASCPAEICIQCGKARDRIVEAGELVRNPTTHVSYGYTRERSKVATDTEPMGKTKAVNFVNDGVIPGLTRTWKTIGWTTCSCPSPSYRPGIVLDPFAGSGTTAVVAKSLQRSSISIELAEHYIPIIKERLDWNHPTLDQAIEWVEVA